MPAYNPNPSDTSEPKDSRGVGSAAAEFRAIKQYITAMNAQLAAVTASQTALAAATAAVLADIQDAAASFQGGDIGQIVPFMRIPTSGVDLPNHLLCDGRHVGRMRIDSDGDTDPQPQLYAEDDKYFDVYEAIWDFLKYANTLWASMPENISAADEDCPLFVATWSSTAWVTQTVAQVLTAEGPTVEAIALWESGNYALYLPALQGRGIRGANPYSSLIPVPDASEPEAVFIAKPDYGRIPGTYQAASLLVGEDTSGNNTMSYRNVGPSAADEIDGYLPMREQLGWDKVGVQDTDTGYPYARLATSDDTGTELKSVIGISSAAATTKKGLTMYETFMGAARTDNFSLPYYIRYR